MSGFSVKNGQTHQTLETRDLAGGAVALIPVRSGCGIKQDGDNEDGQEQMGFRDNTG